jgi:hypothetical protein
MFCVLAAVGYGVVHDQITARVCVEYFTIGHPPLFTFPTESPTLLGFGWGVAATWWVGLILGIILAAVARCGRSRPIDVQQLGRPVLILLAIAGGCALVMGLIGYRLAVSDVVILLEPLASRVPAEKHDAFIADLWAHATSYAVAFCGGTVLIVRTWLRRKGQPPATTRA